MKKFKISWYSGQISHCRFIYADTYDEDYRLAWGTVDADDIYIEEIKEDAADGLSPHRSK